MTDANYYSFLTEAQEEFTNQFAIHCPGFLYSAPAAMSTADSGLTYTFAGGITPLRAEIYSTYPNGRLMLPAAYWNFGGDYILEGARIRFPGGASQATIPYARTISPSGSLDGSTAPTLLPDWSRILLVYRAAVKWATRGGLHDPAPFQQIEDRAWLGGPGNPGGMLLALKQQHPFTGTAAFASPVLTGIPFYAATLR